MKIYHGETPIRTTKSGATFYNYKYFESFGRESGVARGWGCTEKNGTGLVWAKPGESFKKAISRRTQENQGT